MSLAYRIVEIDHGFMGFVMSERGLRRVVLPLESAAQVQAAVLAEEPSAGEDPHLAEAFAQQLAAYFQGESVDFDVTLDFTGQNDFMVQVWKACCEVGYGTKSTYAELARRVGRPAAARAVGASMGRNPCPIVVPCHRILRSDGTLGGYSGRQGLPFKRRLLDMEAAAALPV